MKGFPDGWRIDNRSPKKAQIIERSLYTMPGRECNRLSIIDYRVRQTMVTAASQDNVRKASYRVMKGSARAGRVVTPRAGGTPEGQRHRHSARPPQGKGRLSSGGIPESASRPGPRSAP